LPIQKNHPVRKAIGLGRPGQEGNRLGKRAAHERVTAAGDRESGSELGVVEGGEDDHHAHRQIHDDAERAHHLGELTRKREDAWPHHRANADHHSHEQANLALELDSIRHPVHAL